MSLPLTQSIADRHEALWLKLSALHGEISRLAARRTRAEVPDSVRILAEGLLADAAGFGRRRGERLAMAAPDFGGLAVQLGQALALLDDFENRHAGWDGTRNCRAWQIGSALHPIRRLRPAIAPPGVETGESADLRQRFTRMLAKRAASDFGDGYRAGLAAGRKADAEPDSGFGASPGASSDASEPHDTGAYPRWRELG